MSKRKEKQRKEKKNAATRRTHFNNFLLFMQIRCACLQEVTADSFTSPGRRLTLKICALNLRGVTFLKGTVSK